ncbi:TniQ family protein [Variovorax soli]|uniref:TniQ family protein n=1 Tax=Variovorax soli TaxID=376815 RepID=UPI0008399380|nr:TniQ family protein [Variovorax soli]
MSALISTVVIGHLPQLEADETLYSLYATAHAMSGNTSAEHTAMALLGTRHAVRQHDIPLRIEPSQFGLPDDASSLLHLIRHHTIAGFYLPFLPAEEQARTAERWRGDCHARRRCDGSSRTIGPRHPLKACFECMESDVQRLGRAYWHVSHQWPLSWVCSVHLTPLRQFDGAHKRWLLPGGRTSAQVQGARGAAPACPVSVLLARFGARIAQTRVVNVDGLREASISRLKALGVMHDARAARPARLCQWFRGTETSAWLRRGPSWAVALADGDWIASQLWRHKHSHAVRWLILWCAIGMADSDITPSTFEDALRGRRTDVQGQRLLFAQEPLGNRTPAHVVAAFNEARSYADVMLALRASRSDIVRWLEADPGLRRDWRDRLRTQRLATIKSELTQKVAMNPQLTRSDLEREHSADVRWLREHAPAELRHLMSQLRSRADKQLLLPGFG